MYSKSKLILSLSAILSLSVSFSSLAAPAPKFDYVQGGYTQFDNDDKMDGFHVEGSYSINENVFIRGEYQEVSENILTDHLEDVTSIALGYKASATPHTDYYMAVSFEEVTSNINGMNDSQDGFGAYAGVKSFVSEQVELYGELSYVDIHDLDMSEIGYELGGQYYFNESWSAGLSYRKLDDTSLVNAGLRYSF